MRGHNTAIQAGPWLRQPRGFARRTLWSPARHIVSGRSCLNAAAARRYADRPDEHRFHFPLSSACSRRLWSADRRCKSLYPPVFWSTVASATSASWKAHGASAWPWCRIARNSMRTRRTCRRTDFVGPLAGPGRPRADLASVRCHACACCTTAPDDRLAPAAEERTR